MPIHSKTFIDLINDLRKALRDLEPLDKRYSLDRKKDAINRALLEMRLDLRDRRKTASYTTIAKAKTLTFTTFFGGTATDDFLECVWLRFDSETSDPLEQLDDYDVKANMDSNIETATFSINNDTIQFGSDVATATVVWLDYIPLPTYLTADTDVPDFRPQYLMLVKHRAASILYGDSKEYDEEANEEQKYQFHKRHLVGVKQRIQDGHSLTDTGESMTGSF